MRKRNRDEIVNRLLVIPANERRKRARETAARRRKLGVTFVERAVPNRKERDMNDDIEVLSVRRYKAGYEVREENMLTHLEDKPPGDTFIMKSAYTPAGDYIGDSKRAHYLCKKRGIKPEKAKPDDCVCSIGFCESSGRWYGWSPKAIAGFAVGDVVKGGDCTNSSGWTDEYLEMHPEEDLSLPVGFTAHTLDDAKRMAISFADSVG